MSGCDGSIAVAGSCDGAIDTLGSCTGDIDTLSCCDDEPIVYAESEDAMFVSFGMAFGTDDDSLLSVIDNLPGLPPVSDLQLQDANPEPVPTGAAESPVFVGGTSLSVGGSDGASVFSEETEPPPPSGGEIEITTTPIGGGGINADVIVPE